MMSGKQGDFTPGTMRFVHLGSSMSAVAGHAITALPARRAGVASWWLAGAAALLGLALEASQIGFVLRGGFADPDDAMRLVEVRAWLAGQPWFDVAAHRLDPPAGASMHWSRLVDLPSALLIKLALPFAGEGRAEALARIILPTILLVLLYLAVARLASLLAGRDMRGAAVLGTFFCGATLAQFQPGRIGHHAMETVCLVAAVGAALASLDPRRAREAAVAGALVALGLAMSLETLPFLGALCAAMALVWVARGSIHAAALAWFAAGLASALVATFLVTVAPHDWFAPVCDAYGAAHCGAGLIGAAGLLVLAGTSRWLPGLAARLCAAAAVGALVVGFVALAFPACLHSPFAGVDPLVRALWLDHVVESKSLPAFMSDRPILGFAMVLPLTFGVAAGVVAAIRTHGLARLRFAIVAGLAALGLALAFWQVRVFASVAPLALCCGLFLVAAARERVSARLAPLAAALILPFTATAWALLLPADAAPASAGADCLAPSAFAPLRGLAPASAVAPLLAGSHLLEATSLDVFAAPYHRNNDGNRFAYEVFLAPPDRARALLASRHVGYIITCAASGETTRLAAVAPDGLAAQLAGDRTPPFLTRLPLAGTPYRVYAVRPGR